MTEMVDLVDEDIREVVITIFYMVKSQMKDWAC